MAKEFHSRDFKIRDSKSGGSLAALYERKDHSSALYQLAKMSYERRYNQGYKDVLPTSIVMETRHFTVQSTPEQSSANNYIDRKPICSR